VYNKVLKIIVAIPVHNALPELKKEIKSLYSGTRPEFKLLVCDDASDTPTYDYIRKINPCRLIVHKNQQWFTRTANDLLIMAYLSGADYIFLVNSDLVFPKSDWMTEMIRLMNKHPRNMLVGSVYSHKSKKRYLNIVKDDFITGHCWLLRSKTISNCGILDETYPHIESDQEYCYRLRRMGYRTIMNQTLAIKHVGGASWGRDIEVLGSIDKTLMRRPINRLILSDPTMCEHIKQKMGV
jgi:GT2 family glycosyltransferase